MAKYSGRKTRLSVQEFDSLDELRASARKVKSEKNFNPVNNIEIFFKKLFNTLIPRGSTMRLIVPGGLIGIFLAFIFIIASDFYNVKSLADFQPNVTTKIYDKNGILIAELFRQKREVVPFEKIPPELVQALIAIEDNEFFEHNGINLKGITRAFFINIFSGRIRQGGSTITQQLAKILLTSQKRNIYRKIKEAIIAVMMEVYYTKEEILSLYLNQIFLGHGAYGVESASNLYFNKHVWEINLAESAILASLPSAPNLLSPIRHPESSMRRHRTVLAKMVEMGFISVQQAEDSYLAFWPGYLEYISGIAPTLNATSLKVNRAPWFTEHIRRDLVNKYGDSRVYEEGLLVYTTLDLVKQQAAEKVMEAALSKQNIISSGLIFSNEDYFFENFYYESGLTADLFGLNTFSKTGSREIIKVNQTIRKDIIEELEGLSLVCGADAIAEIIEDYKSTYTEDRDLQKVEGALISINQRNGYIEAMVGGSEFSSINQLNRVMQSGRQPGSAIKPLLYAAAVESGDFTPASTILDAPIVYLDTEGGDWLPENYEGEYYGLVRLRSALAKSINVVSIRLADMLGIETVMKYYGKLLKIDEADLKRRVPRNFSVALGSFDVTPFELTRAYAIIGNSGRDVIPFSVRFIKDRNGKVIENREDEVNKMLDERSRSGNIQIIKPSTAETLISMLRGVVEGGTGRSAYPGRPAAGKTGTTNNWRDAWFVGFSGNLTTGIWMGYDKMGLSLGAGQSGGSVTAPAWGNYMRLAQSHEAAVPLPEYTSLVSAEVCSRTGLLPSSHCGSVYTEYLVPENVPESHCEVCGSLEVNVNLLKKGPSENISREHREDIIKRIRSGEQNVLDNLGGDLLDY